MTHVNQLDMAKLESTLTPDLREFLWPAAGIYHLDLKLEELIQKGQPKPPPYISLETLNKCYPRKLYSTPLEYYSHMAYVLSQAALFPSDAQSLDEVTKTDQVLAVLVSAILLCQSLGFDFCYSKTAPISLALESLDLEVSQEAKAAKRKNTILTTYTTRTRFILSPLSSVKEQ
jgi:hypothetical protein